MNKAIPWDCMEEHIKNTNERVNRARMMAKTCEQPHFTLLAQDITADLVVEFWVIVNEKLAELVKAGRTPEEAVDHLRGIFHIPPHVYEGLMISPKHASAVRIAREMREYQGGRKVAD